MHITGQNKTTKLTLLCESIGPVQIVKLFKQKVLGVAYKAAAAVQSEVPELYPTAWFTWHWHLLHAVWPQVK